MVEGRVSSATMEGRVSSEPMVEAYATETITPNRRMKTVINFDEEYNCAKVIMKTIEDKLKEKPSLDTCLIRQLCEMMLRTEYPQDDCGCDVPQEVGRVRR